MGGPYGRGPKPVQDKLRFVSPPGWGKTGPVRLSVLLGLALFVFAAAPARAETLHERIEAYALYQLDVSALLDAEIDGAAAVDDALARAARHDPVRVGRGWIAYAALTAAQAPAFAHGVQSRVRAAGRAPVLRQLRRDLTYARRRPPGSAQAIQLIVSSIAADSARMRAAASRYEAIAASLDAAAWVVSPEHGAREARLRAVSSERLTPALAARISIGPLAAAPLTDPDAFGGARFWDALADRGAPTPPPLPPQRLRYSGDADRMLTLAGLIILGAAETESARVDAVLHEQRVQRCLTMQQLQLRQCASVAYNASEDAYCLARHGLAGPSACFSAILQ